MKQEKIATYILKTKNTPLIQFNLQRIKENALGETQYTYNVNITKIFNENKNLFPITLKKDITDNTLMTWINKRKAPKNRQFVNQLMKAIEDERNPLKYVDISYALSLNDTYWISNNTINLKWEEINLYQHPFDEVLAYVAFTGYSKKISGVRSTPELTSSGMLKKCWANRKDGIYLLKGDNLIQRPDKRNQITMEYYASQIAKQMELNYIDYDLEEFHYHNGNKEIICKCKLFTSENIGFTNAYEYFLANEYDTNNEDLSTITNQAKMAKIYGEKEYQDLMIFDALICNQDRHLGNFGYLIDNNTGKFIKPAPIFDNGFSLLAGAAKNELNDIKTYIESINGKYLDFNLQTKLFIQPRHIKQLRSLLNFKFKKHPLYNISDEALERLNEMINIRAKSMIKIYQEKKQKISKKKSQQLER